MQHFEKQLIPKSSLSTVNPNKESVWESKLYYLIQISYFCYDDLTEQQASKLGQGQTTCYTIMILLFEHT